MDADPLSKPTSGSAECDELPVRGSHLDSLWIEIELRTTAEREKVNGPTLACTNRYSRVADGGVSQCPVSRSTAACSRSELRFTLPGSWKVVDKELLQTHGLVKPNPLIGQVMV